MPFKSKSQLRTCYGQKLSAEARGKKSSWDCDEFLEATPDPSCLPERVGDQAGQCRSLRKNERVVSPVYVGPRGGLYFYVAGVRVYVPKDAETHDYVTRTYRPGPEPGRAASPRRTKRSPAAGRKGKRSQPRSG
jgi:hypothetical protein